MKIYRNHSSLGRGGVTLAALWLATAVVVVQCKLKDFGADLNSQIIFDSLKEDDEGSGAVPKSSSGKSSSNPQHADRDDFVYSGDSPLSSDSDDDDDIGSGFAPSLDLPNKYVKCSDVHLHCWCVDSNGKKVAGTNKFHDDFDASVCDGEDKDVFLIGGDGDKTSTIRPLIKSKPRFVTTTQARQPVTTSQTATLFVGKPTKPAEGAGSAGSKGEHEVVREKVLPLFTHPGILAAIIGGGVVTLLCALLFVMFAIYKMRKKDEGSYPLDTATKPRLHTYTQVPNKNLYN